ncbi:BglG family transcriptional antiterminator [Orenia metallireducens]|jgi:mannitol operon transcriptional antiterminator|uniref:Transcriptional antiterminator, BglG family n=1 Tax=Orenia metallireducens TaxID=1413210 RepID=A0A285H741_9FIRM|nr:BglG family transcription antiterminator [Orenia metallireducens]PRX21128.1 BglG family transcriptional antiterminator [Orenia metallireducens]SNY31568.1 transcriptional antiterminator, BglG family [Orenia metallireducens]
MRLNNLSSRQKRIIAILIEASNVVTIKELADEIGVSKRTINRELSSLREALKEFDLTLQSKPGVGLFIEGKEELLERAQKGLKEVSEKKDLTPQERYIYIIEEFLLSDRFQKLTALAYKLAVTEATISYDLNKVAKWFEKRGLSLVRKQGVGVYLKGSEASFRRAVIDFLYDNMEKEDILTLIRNNLNNKRANKETIAARVREKILDFMNMNTLSELEKAVDEILKETKFNMVNTSYIGLIIHLSLAINRLEAGEKIYINKDKLDRLKLSKEYEIAKNLSAKLEEVFDLIIPIEETAYIAMHLKGAKLMNKLEFNGDPLAVEKLEVIKLARILVKEVEQELRVTISDDVTLISGLVTHLEPAISRIKMGMEIRNPILTDLKKEYSDIFSATKKAANKLAEIIEANIPDSEIGFLTMHIAAAVENANRYKAKVLLVCSSGIGSSKILATRLKKTIENLEIIDEVSAFSLEDNRIDEEDIDLIISTIPIDNYQDKLVVVSPILLPEEVQRIKRKIREVEMVNLERDTEREVKKEDRIEDELEVMAKISNDIISILKNVKVKKIAIKDYDQIIREVSKEDFIPLNSDSKVVYDALKAREKKGSTIIPEMKLTLLHARTDGIEKPFIGLVMLDEAVSLSGPNNLEQEIDRIIVLLAPKELIAEEIQLISSFSASIIENKDFHNVIREGNKEELIDYLRKVMEDYYRTLFK